MSKQFSHATTCLYTISWIGLSMLPYRAEKKEKEKKTPPKPFCKCD